MTPDEIAARAERHAEDAERLLEAAGESIFRFQDPMINTREAALMTASVHASLANYYEMKGRL